jgi:glycerol-3-phosphate dehydrogenase
MDNGVELKRNFAVSAIQKQEEGYLLTAASGETVCGKYVLNCAGGYSDKIANMVGDDYFTIIPRAGEYILLDKTEGSRVKHTIFQVPSEEGKGILVSPTVDGNLLTGPTALKVETPESVETTSEGLAMVSRLAAKSVPSVNFRQVITSFNGVRSSAHGDDFIIRASEANSKCVHTGAIDSPGLTSCVAIAKYAVELLEKQGLMLKAKENWNGRRENTRAFREMTDEEKDAFIKENPDYGKIVCRCETVSEGEIRAAIRRNPPAYDIDAVKRRTRSGMGRCQGGFCSPYVMRLIAEEQGMNMEDVTKSGPGSNPLTGKL